MSCDSMSLAQFFLTLLNNIKIYHWQTKSYAEHIATDNLHTVLLPLVDRFIEIYSRDVSRPEGNFDIFVSTSDKIKFMSDIKQAIQCLRTIETKKGINETELLNIRDEIIAECNKLLYLFTFE